MSEARKSLKLENLLGEKTGAVLDIGKKYTKYGIFGSFQPKGFIKSQIKDPVTNELRNIFDYKNQVDLEVILIEFIRKIFFKYFVTSPKDKKILLVESVLSPTLWRDTLAKVLFKHFEVSSLLFVPSHLVALCTLGINTGLVVDIGYTETNVLPIYEGIPILKAWKDINLGGQNVELNIKNMLIENLKRNEEIMKTEETNDESKPTEKTIDIDKTSANDNNPDKFIATIEEVTNLSSNIFEDIKVCSCFVTNQERSEEIFNANPNHLYPKSFNYPLKNGKNLFIPGHIRESAFEILFELDLDMLSIATVILDSLLSVSRDSKRQLAENIVLIGGTAMTPGLKYRLNQELLSLLNNTNYKDKLYIKKFKFHTFPAKENYVAWLGGAIFAATESYNKRAIQKGSVSS